MKSCPTCKRSYKDDSLSFCLEDGARLTSIFDLRETTPASSLHGSDTAKTAILPTHLTGSEASQPQATIAAVASGSYGRSTNPNEFTETGGNNLWLILGGIFAIAVVGVVIVLGYLAFKSYDSRLTGSSASTPNVQTNTTVQTNDSVQPNGNTKTNVNVQANSNVRVNSNAQTNLSVEVNSNTLVNANRAIQSNIPDEASLSWLEGVWTGEGYQSDTQTTWTIRLTVHDGNFAVEYPNIPCRGTWTVTSKHSRGASFIETITQGTDRCVNGERILIERVSESEISCKFSHAGSRVVIATAVLTRKEL
jgi:hypothetical protein